VLAALAAVFFLLNRPGESEAEADVLAVKPVPVGELVSRGRAAMEAGAYADAVGFLEDAANTAPREPMHHVLLSRAHRLGKTPEAALQVLQHAGSLGLESPELYFELACVQAALRYDNEAFESLGEAVKHGLTETQRISTEADLSRLVGDPRVQQMLGK